MSDDGCGLRFRAFAFTVLGREFRAQDLAGVGRNLKRWPVVS